MRERVKEREMHREEERGRQTDKQSTIEGGRKIERERKREQ